MAKRQTKYSNKYKKENQHRVNINYSREKADDIKAFCKDIGVPVNTFIKEAISEKLAREGVDINSFETESEVENNG